MKKVALNTIICGVLLSMPVFNVSAIRITLSDVASILAGVGSGLVAKDAAWQACHEWYDADWKSIKHIGKENLKHFGSFLGLMYAVSKFAPYSRRRLTLQPAELISLHQKNSASNDRATALLKGLLLSGIIIPSGLSLWDTNWKEKPGVCLAYLYTLFQLTPIAWNNLTTGLGA